MKFFLPFLFLCLSLSASIKDFDFDKDFRTDIKSIRTLEDLNFIEYKLALLDSYNWLSFNFKDIFKIDEKIIKNEKSYLNELVMFFLKEEGQLYKKCQKCQTHIPLGQYNYCNSCYKSHGNKGNDGRDLRKNKRSYFNRQNKKNNKK